MNTETQEQKVQTLRSTLAEMLVSELPKVHANSHDALYRLYSSLRRKIDGQRDDAQRLYHEEVEKLACECEQYVLMGKQRIAEEEVNIAKYERSTKQLAALKREQFAECVRRHADGMRALKLWYTREFRQIEASQSHDVTPIEPETSITL